MQCGHPTMEYTVTLPFSSILSGSGFNKYFHNSNYKINYNGCNCKKLPSHSEVVGHGEQTIIFNTNSFFFFFFF